MISDDYLKQLWNRVLGTYTCDFYYRLAIAFPDIKPTLEWVEDADIRKNARLLIVRYNSGDEGK
jgi:hypothetical protein